MHCPNCGNELDEEKKYCTNCGAKLDGSDMPEVINIKWVVISIVAIALVFGTCILATQNSNPPTDTINDKTNNEVVEDTTTVDDTPEYTAEEEPQRPIAPKPKCVYETSDGVCFTTQIFKVTPMNYYDCTGGWTTYEEERLAGEEARSYGITLCKPEYDNWAGAAKMCGDWGYKLPSEADLTSLARDIFGINISNEPSQRSYCPSWKKINTAPIKALKPDATPKNFGTALWEDTEESSTLAHARRIYIFENEYGNPASSYTQRISGSRPPYYIGTIERAVCVYDPYGVAKTKYVPPKPKPVQTSKPQTSEKQQTPVQQQAPAADEKYNKEAENALF